MFKYLVHYKSDYGNFNKFFVIECNRELWHNHSDKRMIAEKLGVSYNPDIEDDVIFYPYSEVGHQVITLVDDAAPLWHMS